MAEARIALQRVILTSTNAALCSQARRELVNDAMRFNNITTALALSKQLADQPNSVFYDKLLRLAVAENQSNQFRPNPCLISARSRNQSQSIFGLAIWEMKQVSTSHACLVAKPPNPDPDKPAGVLADRAMPDGAGRLDRIAGRHPATRLE